MGWIKMMHGCAFIVTKTKPGNPGRTSCMDGYSSRMCQIISSFSLTSMVHVLYVIMPW